MFRNPSMGPRGGYQPARAFDATGASGQAFLESQLELINPKMIEPLQGITHTRDLPMKYGGGFPQFTSAFATNYGSTGSQLSGLQGTSNTEIPLVQADVQKGVWDVYDWAASMAIKYLDLQRLETASRNGQPPPISLQKLYEDSCKVLWNKDLDRMAYKGFLNRPGLLNNTNAPETTVPQGSTTYTTWLKKSFPEILADVNFGTNAILANSGYDGVNAVPDRLLVPYEQFGYISAPATLGGVGAGFNSIQSYIEHECIAAKLLRAEGKEFKIYPLPDPWISGIGAGSPPSDRGCLYRNDENCLLLWVPQVMTKGFTVPTDKNGGSWVSIWYGAIGQINFYRTSTMCYLDGI